MILTNRDIISRFVREESITEEKHYDFQKRSKRGEMMNWQHLISRKLDEIGLYHDSLDKEIR